MVTKFEIEQRIIDNNRQRNLEPNIDKLEFLVPIKISNEFLESDSFSILRNSKTKKFLYLIIGVVHVVALFQVTIKYDLTQAWPWIILIAFSMSCIWFLWRFMENKAILKIAPEGLTIYPNIINKWEEIEYLHFHTKYDGEGSEIGVFLIVNLKTLSNYEIIVSDIEWSLEKLGRTLYQCMRKYGK